MLQIVNSKTKVHMLKKVAEGLQSDMGCETTKQSTASPTGKLIGRGHFVHCIPAAEPKAYGKLQCMCMVNAGRGKPGNGKTVKELTTVYSQKCDTELCSKTSSTQRLQNSGRPIADMTKFILDTQTCDR
jgi:hypothetical protein